MENGVDWMVGESAYDCVMRRLAAREKGAPMTLEEAQEIVKYTRINIVVDPYDNKYRWFTTMSEWGGFNTPREALDDAVQYLKGCGCFY